MKPTYSRKQTKHWLTAIAALSLAATISSAQAASGTSENTQEFLSDPHRVGTIAGSILGGVITAHPAGSIAGSIIGYVFGKQSIFKSHETASFAQQAGYAKRSIIPESADTSLAKTTLIPEPEGIQPAPSMPEPESIQHSPSTPEQIASYCYGNQGNASDPKLMAMCYYYSRI